MVWLSSLTLRTPVRSSRQRKAVTAAGLYTVGAKGREYPKLQILTIEGLMNNTEPPRFPDLAMGRSTFKRAAVEDMGAEQGRLLYNTIKMKKWFKKQWESIRDNAILSLIMVVISLLGANTLREYARAGFKLSADILRQINLQSFIVDTILLFLALRILEIERRIAQMDQKSDFFRSDTEHTKFINSSWQHANVRNGMLAVESDPDERCWAIANAKYPQLEGCIWLAHDKHITDDEAIKGGTYKFSRDIYLPCKLSALKHAGLQLVVDDECELSLNGHQFQKVRGYLEKIHSFDLLPHFIEGKNALEFLIHNDSFEDKNNPQTNPDFFYFKEKWKINPYGFKYLITLRFLQ